MKRNGFRRRTWEAWLTFAVRTGIHGRAVRKISATLCPYPKRTPEQQQRLEAEYDAKFAS